ncbi:MAG TPA: DUF4293 family protein [Ferruginibacter sp.]|nr:DUF4293 family protein [Ferruginibacter sp.]
MLQRIQSIWLLLASVCSFAGLKFFFYSGKVNEVSSNAVNGASTYVTLNGFQNIYITVLTIAIGILALIIIFLYKNRNFQMRLCAIGIGLEAILIYLYYQEVSTLFIQGSYSITALLQAAIILFFILAIRGIARDNKLIRDSNRLR